LFLTLIKYFGGCDHFSTLKGGRSTVPITAWMTIHLWYFTLPDTVHPTNKKKKHTSNIYVWTYSRIYFLNPIFYMYSLVYKRVMNLYICYFIKPANIQSRDDRCKDNINFHGGLLRTKYSPTQFQIVYYLSRSSLTYSILS